ncbi:mitochondrial transcription rescue factor 1 [Belonocnema kinseyi]|uniref:mitochondrial transcription rescue factor 1 n=1 Tax=Belonocnema kinseyi TaxID=2817044 RepID=UPI00143DA7D3|nr:mitochondrial transcription rescue factor 1 [Belonocnema kinseyi]
MLSRRFICNFTHRNFISIYKKSFQTLQCNVSNTVDGKRNFLFQNPTPNPYTVKRFKKKKHSEKQQQNEVFEDDEEDETVEPLEPFEKIVSKTVPSMRLDGIIKAGLGMARNKVDLAFYESKVRVNGKKILKKSTEVHEGDEIDILVGKSPDNPDFLVVHRVKIVSSNFAASGCKVNIIRDKSLVIAEYKDRSRE